jgi:uncharacterized protein
MKESDNPVVIDTNAYISALINPSGTVAQAIDAAISRGNILHSDDTFDELKEKFASKRLGKFISQERRDRMLEILSDISVRVEAPHVFDVCRDKDDNKFLDLAFHGGARIIISGDKDLLDVGRVQGSGHDVEVVSPRDYLDRHPRRSSPAAGPFFTPAAPAVS